MAGASVMERNPLLQPISTLGNTSYSLQPNLAASKANQLQGQIEQRNYDLLNPDNQYLRYKHLMNSQYYNLQANTQGYQQATQKPL